MTEYTGIESFVREQIDNHEIAWVPIYRALNVDFEEDNNLTQDKKIELLANRLENLNGKNKQKR
jgi:hypothetical protein